MSSSDLYARLAELEQRVGELEGGGAEVDQLSPGVFSLNASGQLEEILSGQLSAQGVIFQLGSVVGGSGLGPGTAITHEIVWQTEAGVSVAGISAFRHSQKPPGLTKGRALSFAIEWAPEGTSAGLSIELQDAPTVVQRVTASAGAQGVTIIDSTGASAFVLRSTAPRLVASANVAIANLGAGALAKVAPKAVIDSSARWSEAEHRFTPARAGVWQIGCYFAGTVAQPAGTFVDIAFEVNAALLAYAGAMRLESNVAGAGVQGGGSTIVELNGTTDFVELFANSTAAGISGVCTLWALWLGE